MGGGDGGCGIGLLGVPSNNIVIFSGISSLALNQCQGSILDPLLFTSISCVPLSSSSNFQLYADDILLYKPIDRNNVLDVANLQIDIDSIAARMKLLGLCLNAQKTKFLLISRLCQPPPIELTVHDDSVSCKVPSVTYLSPAISPGQPTLTLYVLKSKGRLVCSTGIFTMRVLLEKINCISPKFYRLWITAHPFGIPTMSLASTSWNLSKKLQPCLSPGDGLTTMTPCSATSIGQSYAPEERSRNFCYATVFLNNCSILPPFVFTPHPSPHLRHNHPFALYYPTYH